MTVSEKLHAYVERRPLQPILCDAVNDECEVEAKVEVWVDYTSLGQSQRFGIYCVPCSNIAMSGLLEMEGFREEKL